VCSSGLGVVESATDIKTDTNFGTPSEFGIIGFNPATTR